MRFSNLKMKTNETKIPIIFLRRITYPAESFSTGHHEAISQTVIVLLTVELIQLPVGIPF